MYSRFTSAMLLGTVLMGSTAFAAASNEKPKLQDLAIQVQANTDAIAVNASNIANNTAAINSGVAAINTLSNAVAGNTAAIAALAPPISYDYHNYSVPTTIASKTFTVTGTTTLPGVVSTNNYVETITRTPNGNSTTVTLHRFFPNDGHAIEFDYKATSTSYDFVEERDYPPGSTIPSNTFTLANPVPERTSTMQTGALFGSGSEIAVNSSTAIPNTIQVMNALVGAEPMTVNINGVDTTYNDCIRISATRMNSSGSYGGNAVQTNWYCNGIGLVKRVTFNTSNGLTSVILLTGTTTN